MRNRFSEQLERLHVEMIQIGALCEDAISAAAKALMNGDETLAQAAEDAEREIDEKEREVETLCLKLLLQQQPVAKDLREVSSALKMISDLERIGDQAADIAELTRFVRIPEGTGRQRIQEMAEAVIRMVTDSVDSFVKRDLELAREVCREDDQVDDLFNQVKAELIEMIAKDASSGELWLDLIMVAKYLERIGDHATNVAEWVEYAITGVPVNAVAAALILADKSDVRRSRVRNQDIASFDIHDRVNYSVKKSRLKINEEHTLIKLKLSVDTKFGSVMEYFEIFMERMILCRKAAEKLGLQFKLMINEQQLI